jgi:SAM-dependent methyltransferase
MQPAEFWSIGDYGVVGDLWASPGRDLAASLDVAGRDVIDLGTGTGVTAIAMAQRGAESVVGVDITPRMLAEASRRAAAAGVGVRWVEADLADVPLPGGSADLVVSTFGLIFATEPRKAVDEARRLVRPGGQVVFTSWSPADLFGAIRQVMAAYFPDAPTPWHESEDAIRDVAGPDAVVTERFFTLSVDSPEAFVHQLERWSSPIVLASQALGEQWPTARDQLTDVVSGAGHLESGGYRAQVPYLVTTLTA